MPGTTSPKGSGAGNKENSKSNMKLADAHNARGVKLMKQPNRLLDAEAEFRQAVAIAPTWSVPWYHLGLLFKQEKNWQESMRCNQQAAKFDPKDEAAWWNLGIAATALSDWAEARRAWKNFGVPIPDGEGELKMNLGGVLVRLNPKAAGEVVWANRIDPARAIIHNIPFPASGYRYQDLVLHDGEPKGIRTVQGKPVPVFDVLELLKPSAYATYEVVIEIITPNDLTILTEMAEKRGISTEDWQSTTRHLTAEASHGVLPEAKLPDLGIRQSVKLGVAAKDEAELIKLLNGWKKLQTGCRVVKMSCQLR